MCPMCITTAAIVAAGTASGAGVLGFVAARIVPWRRVSRETRAQQPEPTQGTR
jgi:hypothetical protein